MRIPGFFKNKYVYATLIFFVWLAFFDNNSLVNQHRLSSSLKEMEREMEFYRQEIEKNKTASHQLMTDKEVLERFAREKYLMKKDDEDLFLIIKE